MYLKYGTAAIIKMGPFVDETDGVTPETGLSIAQGDIQISKNGAAFAQTSDTGPTTTHDADGWYPVPLTTGDTDTLGSLTVQVAMSGALPVWRDRQVVPANVYDSLFSTSDYLQVDAMQVEGGDATDAINAACDTALSDYDAPTKAELDSGLAALNDLSSTESQDAAAAALTAYDPPTKGELDSGLAALNDLSSTEAQDSAAAALTAYDPPTDAEMDAGFAGLNDLSSTEAQDSAAAALTAYGVTTTGDLAGITASLSSTDIDDIADAVWDEAQSGHTTTGTFGKYLDSSISGVGGAIGSGADACTITITVESVALADADVWISTDSGGGNVVAGTLQTDDNGQATFMLDEGNTYYLWMQKAGYNSIQGEEFTAVAD